MKIKELKPSNIYYDALMYLYSQATKDSGDDPSDDIELAFETLEEVLDDYQEIKHRLIGYLAGRDIKPQKLIKELLEIVFHLGK